MGPRRPRRSRSARVPARRWWPGRPRREPGRIWPAAGDGERAACGPRAPPGSVGPGGCTLRPCHGPWLRPGRAAHLPAAPRGVAEQGPWATCSSQAGRGGGGGRQRDAARAERPFSDAAPLRCALLFRGLAPRRGPPTARPHTLLTHHAKQECLVFGPFPLSLRRGHWNAGAEAADERAGGRAQAGGRRASGPHREGPPGPLQRAGGCHPQSAPARVCGA